jgi:hypothetical protein
MDAEPALSAAVMPALSTRDPDVDRRRIPVTTGGMSPDARGGHAEGVGHDTT